MPDVLIRDVDSQTHRALQHRAKQAGMSLQGYISQLLDQHTAQPSLNEWLENLSELPRHTALRGADAIGAAREELP